MSDLGGVPVGGKKIKKFVVPMRPGEEDKPEPPTVGKQGGKLEKISSSNISHKQSSIGNMEDKKPRKARTVVVKQQEENKEVGEKENKVADIVVIDSSTTKEKEVNKDTDNIKEKEVKNRQIIESKPIPIIEDFVHENKKAEAPRPHSENNKTGMNANVKRDGEPGKNKLKIVESSTSTRKPNKGITDAKKMDEEKKKQVKKTKRSEVEEMEIEENKTDEEEEDDQEEMVLHSDDEKDRIEQPISDSEDEEGPKRKENDLPIGLYLRKNRMNIISKYNFRRNLGQKDEILMEGSTNHKSSLIDPNHNRRRTHKDKEPIPLFHFSGIEIQDLPYMKRIIRKLKGEFDDDKLYQFSHLIVKKKNPSKTKKILYAIVRDCWILTPEYLFESLCQGKWMDPEQYQSDSFMSKGKRPDWRQLFNKKKVYVSIVAYEAGFDYTSLRNLCVLVGMMVMETTDQNEILLSNKLKDNEAPRGIRVDYVWLLDCLVKGELVPIDSYKF